MVLLQIHYDPDNPCLHHYVSNHVLKMPFSLFTGEKCPGDSLEGGQSSLLHRPVRYDMTDSWKLVFTNVNSES